MRLAHLPAVLGVYVAAGLAWAAPVRPAGSFTIPAHEFDAANIRVSQVGQAYADKHACIWNAGAVPNQAEGAGCGSVLARPSVECRSDMRREKGSSGMGSTKPNMPE